LRGQPDSAGFLPGQALVMPGAETASLFLFFLNDEYPGVV
jgi:hypothetical protein